MKTIPYARQWIDKTDIKAVSDCLRSEYLTQGPRIGLFEKMVSSYVGVKYAVVVNSGTSALHIACLAAGLKTGDEAITSPITFVASANSILYCGAKPVFADIEEDTVCIDHREIINKLNRKTKVLIPVDFAGCPAELKQIKEIADKKGLIVIEDAAHALGAKYHGDKVGSCKYSDMTILSFHPVKHITTAEGGMVLTNDKILYKKLKLLRSHGITREIKTNNQPWYYQMQQLGFNYRLTDLQCSLGISQFKKLPTFIKIRKDIVQEYNMAFSGYKQIKLLKEPKNVSSSHHLYVVRFRSEYFKVSRKEIFKEYLKNGISVNVHYIPVHHHYYYRKFGLNKNCDCPKAEKYYKEAITLPLFPKMTGQEIKKVISVTKSIINKFSK